MNKVKLLIFIISIILFACQQEPVADDMNELTTIILVRHAEKDNDGTKNPPLIEAGLIRAQALADMLRETKIQALYSTNYIRTTSTLAALAEQKQLTIKKYTAFDFDELKQLCDTHAGETIVISGHSNNIPWIVNMLTGEGSLSDFDEKDYDNLIIVSLSKSGKGKFIHLNYGEATL